MVRIIKHEGKEYVRVRDKLILVDHYDANGNPVIGCWSEETPNENGGTDCTVHVGCFRLGAIPQKPM